MIRKAIKQNIRIKEYNDINGLNILWPILESLHNKLGYNHLNKEYYLNILKYYMPKNQAKILIAYKNDIPISGVVLIGNGYMVHYWKGASRYNIKNEGQGDLLQWEAIKWAKMRGAKYYDLCVIEPERLPQIARFKMGFSKQLVPFYLFSKSTLTYKVFNRLQKLYK